MTTYLEDDSFFTNIHIPGQFGWSTLIGWITTKNVPCFRVIYDQEADTDFLNIKERLDLYPGIKTFATVMNPWARAALCYEHLMLAKDNGIDHPFLRYFDCTSFESFVLSWPEAQYENSWFKLSTPQIEWLEYIDDNGEVKTADYIWRAEHLDEEFKTFQKYFDLEDAPLIHLEKYPVYKHLFSVEMIQHIEKLFYKDVDRFGYKF